MKQRVLMPQSEVAASGQHLSALVAVSLFAALWLPLGQHEFLVPHWMKVGTFAAPFLVLGYAASTSNRPRLSDPRFASIALLVAYIAHQFEEHWIDVLGNEYAFHAYVNALVRGAIGTDDLSVAPLTPMGIFVINTSLVWLVGAVAIVRARTQWFPVFAMAAIALVNGATHIIGSIVTFAYNPGLLTSVLLFLPLPVLFYRKVLRENPALKLLVIASLIWAALAHVLMVGGMLAANLFGVISESFYFVTLVVWSLLPLGLFRSFRRDNGA
ncbi:MAG: HXXEE domain-containing protein [Pseudomonadota bacterium]